MVLAPATGNYFCQNLTFWKMIITAGYLSEKQGHLCPLPLVHRRPNGLLTPREVTPAGSCPPVITTGYVRVPLAPAVAGTTRKEDGQSSKDSVTAIQQVTHLVREHAALGTAARARTHRLGKLVKNYTVDTL